jgi:3-deoxy-D-manno-octulosonic-acid transferase
MRRVYTALLYVLTPVILLRLLWRGLRSPGYLHRWRERFGHFEAPEIAGCIWVHAVSVGEVNAAVPLVRALKKTHPGVPFVLTTVTPTGSSQVEQIFGDDVFHVYAPYDLPGAVQRFLDKLRPRTAVVMETEIWPNLYHACRQNDIPLVMANGRVSVSSVQGYHHARRLFGPALACVSAVAAQSREDAERLIALGVPADRVEVSGSVKFDISLPNDMVDKGQAMRAEWGADRPVWIAASTHEGEDEHVLDAFARVRMKLPEALLLLVPRHPERFARVAALVKKRGFTMAQRSRAQVPDRDTHVFLVDTMGELPLFYVPADIAFVGGSLVPVGGHNVLEASALGKPVIVGPYTYNFGEITDALFDVGAAICVRDGHALGDAVVELFASEQRCRSVGEAGRQVVHDNRGALERMLKVIERHVPLDDQIKVQR